MAQAATPGDTTTDVAQPKPDVAQPKPEVTPPKRTSARRLSPSVKSSVDRSGKKRLGKASFYAHMFAGRKMADGNKMNPAHSNAASRTLPLGTTARVTNLERG